eukprot:s753_g5.t1
MEGTAEENTGIEVEKEGAVGVVTCGKASGANPLSALLDNDLGDLWGNRGLAEASSSKVVKGKRALTESADDSQAADGEDQDEADVEPAPKKSAAAKALAAAMSQLTLEDAKEPETPTQPKRRKIGKQPDQETDASMSTMQVALALAQFAAKGTGKGKKGGKGGKGAKGLASSNSSGKDFNKSDAAYQEACNLLQGLDDTQGIFTLTVAKWTAAIDKVAGRLTPEAMDAISSGTPEQKAKGLEKIQSLRVVEAQLKAFRKLVESLGAADGGPLKPEFMKAALSHALMSNVKASPAVHDILAVRTITCYQQASDWQSIQSYLLVQALGGTSLQMESLKHGAAAALEILEHVAKDDDLISLAPVKDFQQQVEYAVLALSAMGLAFDSVTQDSVARFQSAMKCLMSCPFKKTFLVQPMGAKISESLAEYTTFLRTKKAVCLELASLMLGPCIEI